MKYPGAVYTGKKGRKYLVTYNYQHDISVKLPPNFKDAKHIAKISYSRGGKKGGVDVFELTEKTPDPSEIITNKKRFEMQGSAVVLFETNPTLETKVDKKDLKNVSQKYDVQAEVLKDKKKTWNEIKTLVNTDILTFCGDYTAKKIRGTRTEFVEKIVPITQLKTINPERILTGGKQEFVPECKLEANIDFGKGCVTSWIPQGIANFDGKTFKNFFSYWWGECDYCYAGRQHKSFPKTIYKFDKNRLLEELKGNCRLSFGSNTFLGRPVKTLRFGKRTETCSPSTNNQFTQTLEAMTETGTKGIITTKFLSFNKEIATLFKKTKSSLLYSIGFDELELGACEHGCNNEFRLEQARKYHKVGVNSNIYLLIKAHSPITERDSKILSFAKQHNLPVQLLPVRYKNKELAKTMTGISWNFLKGSKKPKNQLELDIFEEFWRSHTTSKGVSLIPTKIHSDWTNLIKDNKERIRMCHHDDNNTYCGNCFTNNRETI